MITLGIKIVLHFAGDMGVGKSCLLHQFTEKKCKYFNSCFCVIITLLLVTWDVFLKYATNSLLHCGCCFRVQHVLLICSGFIKSTCTWASQGHIAKFVLVSIAWNSQKCFCMDGWDACALLEHLPKHYASYAHFYIWVERDDVRWSFPSNGTKQWHSYTSSKREGKNETNAKKRKSHLKLSTILKL